MNKKQYVLEVLDIIKDTRPIAEGFSYLIEKNTFDDKIFDILVSIIQQSIHQATSDIDKKILEKAKDIFHKIQQLETDQHKIDEEDIIKLENMINTF